MLRLNGPTNIYVQTKDRYARCHIQPCRAIFIWYQILIHKPKYTWKWSLTLVLAKLVLIILTETVWETLWTVANIIILWFVYVFSFANISEYGARLYNQQDWLWDWTSNQTCKQLLAYWAPNPCTQNLLINTVRKCWKSFEKWPQSTQKFWETGISFSLAPLSTH